MAMQCYWERTTALLNKMKKVELFSYNLQLKIVWATKLYHCWTCWIPMVKQGLRSSYLKPPVNTFIALRCMKGQITATVLTQK